MRAGAIFLNCIEDRSNYFARLRNQYLKEKDYQRYLELIKQGLGLLKLSVKVISVFEERENFFLNLESNKPEQEYSRILADEPDMLFALEIAFRKLGVSKKKIVELRNQYGNADPIYKRIFDNVKIKIDFELTDKIEKFKTELLKYDLNAQWFRMAHHALMMAMADNELEHVVETAPIKRPIEIMEKLPEPISRHLSSSARQKLLKMYKKELDELSAIQKEELKESELFLFRSHERLKGMIDELSRELKDTLFKMEKLIDRMDVIKQINQMASKLQRMLLMQLHHFQDHEAKRKASLEILSQFDDIKAKKPPSNILSTFEEIIFFRGTNRPPARVVKKFAEYLIGEIDSKFRNRKSKKMALLRKYERKGMLGVNLDTDLVLENYFSFVKKIFLPAMINRLLREMVVIWPYGDHAVDFGYFAGIHLRDDESCPKKLKHCCESLRRAVSVLTYDIRGSTYMGTRLRDAEKEWKIKYKFSQIMSGIAKRYGGYLLKDTGDGGIVWFGENSKSTYDRSYIETITVKGVKIRQSIFTGREFELQPSNEASIRAVKCGLEMVRAAEEFIKTNFIHYRDWFGEVSKREVKVEGVTYALLPPEFRSLFRIGVGIASGQPSRDIFFGINSYGDPDVVGPLLAESHLYSMGRDPNRSVVIVDFPTLANLLLNTSKFTYHGVDNKNPEVVAQEVSQIRDKIRDYTFPDLRSRAVRSGIHILEEADKLKALDFGYQGDILIDDEGNLFDKNGTMINLLFEVISE